MAAGAAAHIRFVGAHLVNNKIDSKLEAAAVARGPHSSADPLSPRCWRKIAYDLCACGAPSATCRAKAWRAASVRPLSASAMALRTVVQLERGVNVNQPVVATGDGARGYQIHSSRVTRRRRRRQRRRARPRGRCCPGRRHATPRRRPRGRSIAPRRPPCPTRRAVARSAKLDDARNHQQFAQRHGLRARVAARVAAVRHALRRQRCRPVALRVAVHGQRRQAGGASRGNRRTLPRHRAHCRAAASRSPAAQNGERRRATRVRDEMGSRRSRRRYRSRACRRR